MQPGVRVRLPCGHREGVPAFLLRSNSNAVAKYARHLLSPTPLPPPGASLVAGEAGGAERTWTVPAWMGGAEGASEGEETPLLRLATGKGRHRFFLLLSEGERRAAREVEVEGQARRTLRTGVAFALPPGVGDAQSLLMLPAELEEDVVGTVVETKKGSVLVALDHTECLPPSLRRPLGVRKGAVQKVYYDDDDDEGEADKGRGGDGERRKEEEEEVRAELERRREWTNRVRALHPAAAEAAEREWAREGAMEGAREGARVGSIRLEA